MSRAPGADRSAAALDGLAETERAALYERLRADGADATAVARLSPTELARAAHEAGLALAPLADPGAMRAALLHHRARALGLFWAAGPCDVEPDGFGFLRSPAAEFASGKDDVYVSGNQLLHLGLRTGHFVEGPARPPRADEEHAALLRVERVGGRSLREHLCTTPFEACAAVVPHTEMAFEPSRSSLAVEAATRLAPLAHGQRVLFAFDDAGTSRVRVLGEFAAAAHAAEPDLVVQTCLLEATAEDRAALAHLVPTAEIAVAGFEAPPQRQIEVAEMALARAQRTAEAGARVLLLIDSLASLLRAGRSALPRGDHRTNDVAHPATLRVKRVFAAARQLDGRGSLTVFASLRAVGDQALDAEFANLLLQKCSAAVAFAADGTGLPDPQRTRTSGQDLAKPFAADRSIEDLRARLAAVPPSQRLETWPSELADGRRTS